VRPAATRRMAERRETHLARQIETKGAGHDFGLEEALALGCSRHLPSGQAARDQSGLAHSEAERSCFGGSHLLVGSAARIMARTTSRLWIGPTLGSHMVSKAKRWAPTAAVRSIM
jgi:hypothetical protein